MGFQALMATECNGVFSGDTNSIFTPLIAPEDFITPPDVYSKHQQIR
jgi:hypothetical protein